MDRTGKVFTNIQMKIYRHADPTYIGYGNYMTK